MNTNEHEIPKMIYICSNNPYTVDFSHEMFSRSLQVLNSTILVHCLFYIYAYLIPKGPQAL